MVPGHSPKIEWMPRAAEMADMKRLNDITRERMFFGALEKAYSRVVMEARISEMAISTYAPVWAQTLMSTGGHMISPSPPRETGRTPAAPVPQMDFL